MNTARLAPPATTGNQSKEPDIKRLKQMFADLNLKNRVLKDVIEKKL